MGASEMYPAKFDYHRASTVEEALDLLEQNEDAKVLAGGHSLLPMMKLRLAQPATIVDIGRIGHPDRGGAGCPGSPRHGAGGPVRL